VKEALASMTTTLYFNFYTSSKFFTASAGCSLALVSIRARAKCGIGRARGGPNRARAPARCCEEPECVKKTPKTTPRKNLKSGKNGFREVAYFGF
jgi:hypothetical protein